MNNEIISIETLEKISNLEKENKTLKENNKDYLDRITEVLKLLENNDVDVIRWIGAYWKEDLKERIIYILKRGEEDESNRFIK